MTDSSFNVWMSFLPLVSTSVLSHHVCNGSTGSSCWLPAGRSPHRVLRGSQDCSEHRPEWPALHRELVRTICPLHKCVFCLFFKKKDVCVDAVLWQQKTFCSCCVRCWKCDSDAVFTLWAGRNLTCVFFLFSKMHVCSLCKVFVHPSVNLLACMRCG